MNERKNLRLAGGRSSEEGFSILEMVGSLALTALILIGVLNLFELMDRAGRVQNDVAEMQQAMRVAQYELLKISRMAGRGGMPQGALPTGLAVALRNNVNTSDANLEIAPGWADTPMAAEDSDVLTIRGVIQSSIYQVDPTNPASLKLLGNPPDRGEIVVPNRTPTGVPLDLQPLKDVENLPEALLIMSPLGEYAVVELDPGASTFVESGGVITQATLPFRISSGTHTAAYTALNAGGIFSPTLREVAFFGILEEYRFYIRDDDFSPALSQARVYPGTDQPYEDDGSNLEADIADNVIDLQVALGIDTDDDNDVEDGEWLFDEAADDPTAALWTGGIGGTPPPLRYLRISTLVRTDRRDRGYQDDPLGSIEDRQYDEGTGPLGVEEMNVRRYRRRIIETTVDVRNL